MRTILAMLGTVVLFVAFAGYLAATVVLSLGLFLATRPIMREPARRRKRKALTDAMLALVTVAMTYRAEEDADAEVPPKSAQV
jgi:hypothetical protein